MDGKGRKQTKSAKFRGCDPSKLGTLKRNIFTLSKWENYSHSIVAGGFELTS